jgi:amidophosphoribosyltransferase
MNALEVKDHVETARPENDSLVRGTTSVKIVRRMREAGAKEVHFRISSPPITHPAFYGINTPEKEKLLAATHDLEQMRQYIEADSLAFLSVEGVHRAMGEIGRKAAQPQFSDKLLHGRLPDSVDGPHRRHSATSRGSRRSRLRPEQSR